jgi:very-short-patch-repair endonuclease
MSKVIPFEKSFASNENAKYWSEKNEVKPRDVFKSSAKKYWFNCECGHNLYSSLNDISNGRWCPYCSNPPQKLCDSEDCQNCFDKSFASNDKSKYWSEKNKVKPRNIFKGSDNTYEFNCECGHSFNRMLYEITRGNWCPYCSNPPKKLCNSEDCKNCFEKSFASNNKSKYWSDKNKVKPRNIFKSSNKKYWFDCECGHIFDSVLTTIIKDHWCPYCSNQKLCDLEDCKSCFEKSFASNDKSKYWSEKNKVKPRNVFKGSNKKYWFNCICGHSFNSSLTQISQDHWCHYCSNQKLCDLEDCKSCFEKSFASNDKSKYWSNKNEINPRDVFKSSSKKYWFNCDKQHIFYSSINSISRGTWCPYCINKTEQKVYEQLVRYYPTLQRQYKVEWCKKKTYLPFDFVIPEHNIIIELDGPQHFMQISNWSSPQEQQINDKYKMDCANKHNYSVIRLLQADVFYDTYDWLEELNQNIKKIMEEKNVQNIYMCKNNEYDIFDNT